jgi:hypothetical protein
MSSFNIVCLDHFVSIDRVVQVPPSCGYGLLLPVVVSFFMPLSTKREYMYMYYWFIWSCITLYTHIIALQVHRHTFRSY